MQYYRRTLDDFVTIQRKTKEQQRETIVKEIRQTCQLSDRTGLDSFVPGRADDHILN